MLAEFGGGAEKFQKVRILVGLKMVFKITNYQFFLIIRRLNSYSGRWNT